MSFPANSAFTSASPGAEVVVTPFMFMASVKQRPVKCRSFFNKPSMMRGDKEAGIPLESNAGTLRCEVIPAGTPASISAR